MEGGKETLEPKGLSPLTNRIQRVDCIFQLSIFSSCWRLPDNSADLLGDG